MDALSENGVESRKIDEEDEEETAEPATGGPFTHSPSPSPPPVTTVPVRALAAVPEVRSAASKPLCHDVGP